MTGPFETERQASETPAVQAVYAAFDAAPGAGARVRLARCPRAGGLFPAAVCDHKAQGSRPCQLANE